MRRTPGPDQMNLGELLRDQGMHRVSTHVDPEWRDACDQAIADFAAAGIEFTVEDIRRRVGEPDRPNAWGAGVDAAAMRRLITLVAIKKSPRAERRAGMVRVWRGTAKATGLASQRAPESTTKPPVVNAGPSGWHDHEELP